MTDHSLREDLRNLQDKTAIVGVGTTEFGAIYRDLDPERSAYELGLIAFREALIDSGLRKSDIDGVIVSRLPHYGRMCEMIGLRHPRFANVLPGEGRQSGIALQYAAMAVASGMASAVACIYGNNGRSTGARYGGEDRGHTPQAMFEAPYGMTSPGAVTSLMFRRHQYRYGTTTEPLGHLAISNRANAALNPNAVMQKPITMDDYYGARFIAEPLCLLDYCLINDGGVCFIVTSAERARDLKHTPVLIHATSQASDITPVYVADDFWYTPMSQIADDLFAISEAQREDLAFAQLYDNFTPTMLFTLEGMDFCEQGEGGDWITPERINLHGELPLNTGGGHTSESYMQGWALHVEAVRQLRGKCGDRQVANAQYGLYACAAPLATGHVLKRDD